uniref:Amino acid permease/ SLC12A domain-containing protein n=1 Tax=Biomphalaria glabrata TaxID=6526 RepID=A0A2C9KS78_BIOGL
MLLTFSKYLVSMFPTCGSPQHLEKMIAALTLVFLFLVNSYSSKLATRISVLTTLGKVAALLVICVGGVVAMVQGATSELPSGFSGTKSDATPIAMAFYNALWAYSGASFLNCLVEEVKSPDKNVPKSIVMGTVLVIFIYVMTNVSYLAVMTRSELLQSDAVAALFADRVLRNFSLLIPVAVMISTLGATNNALFGYSRVTFAAARDGNLPDCLSYVHITQFTPFGALALTVSENNIFLRLLNFSPL